MSPERDGEEDEPELDARNADERRTLLWVLGSLEPAKRGSSRGPLPRFCA